MGRLSKAEAAAFTARVDSALQSGQVHSTVWHEANQAERRKAFAKLGAFQILKLARKLGVQAPKDPDARERFSYAAAVKRELGL